MVGGDFDTVWFHATRVPPDTPFDDGILSLGGALPNIWSMLEPLAMKHITREQWQGFMKAPQDGEGAFQFHLKTGDPLFHGPYGFLVREVVFDPDDLGHHDYLDVPEIIEDIGFSFRSTFGCDLLEDFKAATVPCLVTFKSFAPRPDALRVAMTYVYAKSWGLSLGTQTNTSYDGEGCTVPAANIVAVEFGPRG